MRSSRACARPEPVRLRLGRALRGLALSAWLLAPAALLAQAPAQIDVDTLLGAFSRMPGLEARFVEEKRIGLLAQPLESRGRLYFTKPGLLLRRVEAPLRSEVVITPNEVRLREDGKEQAIDLRARRDLRPFIESLVWILAGNRKALGDVYTIGFEPAQGDAPWQLTLTPKGEPLSRLITNIRIRGKGLAVSEIQVRESSGDETLTRILEANPARQFDAKERQLLFGVAAGPATATGGSAP